MKIHVYVTEEPTAHGANWSVWIGCGLALTVVLDDSIMDPDLVAHACAAVVATMVESNGWGEVCLCDNDRGNAPCGTKASRESLRAKG